MEGQEKQDELNQGENTSTVQENKKEGKGEDILKEVDEEEEEDEEESQQEDPSKPQKEKLKLGETPEMREKRTIFVGNVPLNIKKKKLVKLFKKYGEIDSVRIRGVGYSAERKPMIGKIAKGTVHENNDTKIAYIVFTEIESANAALEANNTVLQEHHLRVDLSSQSSKKDIRNCVFVANLPRDTKEEGLRLFFEKEVGSVVSVRLIRERNHINCKGFGFVKFKDQASYKACLGLNHQASYQGRVLGIDPAQKMNNTESKVPIRSRSYIFERKVKDVDDGMYGAERRVHEKKLKEKVVKQKEQQQNNKRKRNEDLGPNKKQKKNQPPPQNPTQKYKRYQKKVRANKKKT
uniref:RRM domain-containing protein n=1 Tax=Arcella intermedia TaxID=1963864 RepID=A0A6B2L772_9EUKA